LQYNVRETPYVRVENMTPKSVEEAPGGFGILSSATVMIEGKEVGWSSESELLSKPKPGWAKPKPGLLGRAGASSEQISH
jgi:hypothetical protein